MSKYTSFWEWFSSQEKYIYDELENHPDEIAEEINVQLKQVHSDLVFDIPFEQVDKMYEFIISADGDSELFDTVFKLVEESPKFQRWLIQALRPRTNQLDQAIDLAGLYLEYEDIFYTVEKNELPLQINAYIRGYDNEDNRYVHGFFLLLDTLIGEYNAVKHVEVLSVSPLEDTDDEPTRFLLLRDLFDSLKGDEQ